MKCDCVDRCRRWLVGEDNSWQSFTPFLPDFVEGHDKECKRLNKPTIYKSENT